jgi:pimeloyl-ACP methyl ester carboxylesterase
LFAFGANYKPNEGGGGPIPPLFDAFMKRARVEYETFNPGKPFDTLLSDILTLWRTYPNWTKVDFDKIPSNIPIWIVGADHEEAIPREQTGTMVSWIPQAGELILPRTSHFALMQEPTRFSTAIEEFLIEATNTTTCSNYRFVCVNNCSPVSSNLFYTFLLVITFRLMFEYAG